MRIAQIIDSLDWGGAQKMQVFLVESLRSLGLDLTVISLSDHADSSIPRELRAAGARVAAFRFPKLFRPDSFVQLVRYLAAEKFDLVQAYLTNANVLSSLAGVLTRTPVIASLRNAGYDPRIYSRNRAFVERLCLRYLATRVVANGYKVAEYWSQHLPGRQIDVVVNAVDPLPGISAAERRALRATILGDPERPLILSVGRLTPQKAFPDLLQAFALVHSAYPEAVLAIAGRGRLQGELARRTAELGLQDHVAWLGIRNDVHRLMAAADLYVNSSHWEGTPVSVLEAMAAGLPAVATSVGETPYLLKDGAGILVPPGQPVRLAEGIQTLLAQPETRQASAQLARERIHREYTREAWKHNMLALYARVSPKAQAYLRMVDGSSVAWAGAGRGSG